MTNLVITGGTADATYSPSTGFSSYFDGFKYLDATSIKTASNGFGILLEDSLTSGDNTTTLSWNIKDSGGAALGPCFMTSAGSGFASSFNNSGDSFALVPFTSGSDGAPFASGAISTYVTVADADPVIATLRYISSTKAVTLKLNGVTVATATYPGSVTSLRGGVAAYNDQFEKITALSVAATSGGATLDSINGGSGVAFGSTGNTINTTGLGTLTSLNIGGLAATSLSATGGDGTFSYPGLSNGITAPLIGSSTATAGDGTSSPTLSTPVLAPSGWTKTDLATVLTTAGYLGFYITCTAGDQVAFPTAATLGVSQFGIDPDGRFFGDKDGLVTIYHIKASNGLVTQLDITFQSGIASVLVSNSTVTAALTTSIKMAAALSSQSSVNGNLTTSVKMAAALTNTQTFTANLNGSSTLAANLSSQSTVSAALSTDIKLAAGVSSQSSVTAALTTSIKMAASLNSQSLVSATFFGTSVPIRKSSIGLGLGLGM